MQEDPDIIEGDEEEVGLTSSGPTGEELLRQHYLLRAMSTTQVAVETKRTPSAQSARRVFTEGCACVCVRVRVCVNVANTVWDYVFYFNVTILK